MLPYCLPEDSADWAAENALALEMDASGAGLLGTWAENVAQAARSAIVSSLPPSCADALLEYPAVFQQENDATGISLPALYEAFGRYECGSIDAFLQRFRETLGERNIAPPDVALVFGAMLSPALMRIIPPEVGGKPSTWAAWWATAKEELVKKVSESAPFADLPPDIKADTIQLAFASAYPHWLMAGGMTTLDMAAPHYFQAEMTSNPSAVIHGTGQVDELRIALWVSLLLAAHVYSDAPTIRDKAEHFAQTLAQRAGHDLCALPADYAMRLYRALARTLPPETLRALMGHSHGRALFEMFVSGDIARSPVATPKDIIATSRSVYYNSFDIFGTTDAIETLYSLRSPLGGETIAGVMRQLNEIHKSPVALTERNHALGIVASQVALIADALYSGELAGLSESVPSGSIDVLIADALNNGQTQRADELDAFYAPILDGGLTVRDYISSLPAYVSVYAILASEIDVPPRLSASASDLVQAVRATAGDDPHQSAVFWGAYERWMSRLRAMPHEGIAQAVATAIGGETNAATEQLAALAALYYTLMRYEREAPPAQQEQGAQAMHTKDTRRSDRHGIRQMLSTLDGVPADAPDWGAPETQLQNLLSQVPQGIAEKCPSAPRYAPLCWLLRHTAQPGA